MMRRVWHSLGLLLFIGLLGQPVSAQRVELAGRGDLEHDARLEALLSGPYTLIARDTVIANGTTVPGPVLVVGATLRVNGTIEGDLYVVEGNVFLRPTAVVTGQIFNISGGFYPSEQASIATVAVNDPNAPYELERLPDGTLRIVGTNRRTAFVLDGIFGAHIPTYDRVNGLSLAAGAGYAPPPIGRTEPLLHAWAAYRFERSEVEGGAELSATRRRTTVAIGAERNTLTADRWRRGDLTNSVAAIFSGKDYRNYYAADRGWIEVRRLLEEGVRTTNAFVRLQAEDATSLETGDPWHLFGDSLRFNPPVAEERLTSVIAGGVMELEQPRLVAELNLEAEAAFEALDGARSFQRVAFWGEGAVPGLANHTVELEWHLRAPLGGAPLPRQRWTFLGGSSTLYTLDLGSLAGDRVAFAGLRYAIPLPILRGGMLGGPQLVLLHHAGTAWSDSCTGLTPAPCSTEPDLHQNLGVELRFPLFYARVVIDPADSGKPKFSANVSLPKGRRPWER